MLSCGEGQVGSEWWGADACLRLHIADNRGNDCAHSFNNVTRSPLLIFGHSTRYLPVKYMTYMKLLIRHFRSTHFIILEETLDADSFSLLVRLPPPPLPRLPLLHPSTASPVASRPSPPRPLRSFRI